MVRSSALQRISALVPHSVKQRIKTRLGVPGIEYVLGRMLAAGFRPDRIVDVGAYQGDFTTLCKRLYPAASCLMIEPLPGNQAGLRQVASRLEGVQVRQALLGRQAAQAVPFYQNETVSSVLRESEGASGPPLSLPMTTLDDISAGTPFARPDLLKVDVQGYELEVLRGGTGTLSHCEAVLLEVNLLEIYEGAPLMAEVMAFMDLHGFRPYDICTFYRRPYDGALFEVDVLFVSKVSSLVASKRWQ